MGETLDEEGRKGKPSVDYEALLDQAKEDLKEEYPNATPKQIAEGAEFSAGVDQAKAEGRLDFTPEEQATIDAQVADSIKSYPEDATEENIASWRTAAEEGLRIVKYGNQELQRKYAEQQPQSKGLLSRFRKR